ncbi:hypothetical protein F2P81_013397 [Scophthalmus maximus]|uniref:Uncharacterized protein n=1 Tax=Scophthalmus maximus TaxID=52904 RepID=A0A6A4SQQ1_SCOMX|nr:hypothetical protein F2P81_013397 [Scophthalmus maximus]
MCRKPLELMGRVNEVPRRHKSKVQDLSPTSAEDWVCVIASSPSRCLCGSVFIFGCILLPAVDNNGMMSAKYKKKSRKSAVKGAPVPDREAAPEAPETARQSPGRYFGVAEVSLLFPIIRAELDVQNKKYFV